MYVQRNIKERSRNHCCSVKALSFTYSVCFLLSYPACNACPYLQYFSTLSQKTARFSKKKIIEHKMNISIVSTDLTETLLLLGTDRDMIKNVFRSSCKVPFIIVRLKWNLIFLDRFLGKYSNFMKTRPVGTELFMRTDRTVESQQLFVILPKKL